MKFEYNNAHRHKTCFVLFYSISSSILNMYVLINITVKILAIVCITCLPNDARQKYAQFNQNIS
jgi:hypothetical protein